MSILDRIRKLFGGEDIPDEAAAIYRMSKTETEALGRLEEERGRAARHRETISGDIRALSEEDEKLVEEGRGESSGIRRRLVAKRVSEVRAKMASLMNRVDLLTRRVGLFDRQAALLRDRAVLTGPLPDREEVEQAAEDVLVARQAFEEMDEISEVHRDVGRLTGSDEREREALRDLASSGEADVSFDEMLVEEEKRRLGPEEEGREALKE